MLWKKSSADGKCIVSESLLSKVTGDTPVTLPKNKSLTMSTWEPQNPTQWGDLSKIKMAPTEQAVGTKIKKNVSAG